MKITTKSLTGMAMLSALSVISLFIIQFPIFPVVGFMKYDIADVFIFLGTFMYGPVSGLIITAVVSLIQAFLMGGDGLVGALMHFLATGTFALVAGYIYKKNHTIKGALISLLTGFAVWIIVMILADLIVIPLFMGVPRSAVVELLGYLLAFNAIKAGINSILTFILYKQVHKWFRFIGVSENLGRIIDGKTVYTSNSQRQTLKIAKEFAKKLKPGDTVLLNGDLGAGKTVFAKGIARSFGIKEDILSPTFNILKEYNNGNLCHFDMYRIEDDEELENLGFEEYFGNDRLCIVEWNKLPNIYGTVYVVDIIKHLKGNRRVITISKEENYERTCD